MKSFFCVISLLIAFTTTATAVQIDMTDGFVEITGPTTMRVNNVLSMDNYYWADLQWNSSNNTFEVTDVGPMNCVSMEGLWELFYDWDCIGSPSRTTIQFFDDGTFLTGDGNEGTWTQDGCNVDWVYWNNTHYWGVMDNSGLHMEGDMYSNFMGDGCWTADRSLSGMSGDKDEPAAVGSNGESIEEGR